MLNASPYLSTWEKVVRSDLNAPNPEIFWHAAEGEL